MTRLIVSINGLWPALPLICACGWKFVLQLGDEIKIRTAKVGLAHTWYASCPRCLRNVQVVVAAGQLRTGQTCLQNPSRSGIRV